MRFTDNYGAIESIATSSGQRDSGLFELNFRGDRYLPFEGAGLVGSRWKLEMPTEFRQFDYDSISDVVLHIQYTAREGGQQLRDAVVAGLQSAVNEFSTGNTTTGLSHSFSLRHQFPSELNRFLQKTEASEQRSLTLDLIKDRFPYLFKNKNIVISQADIFVRIADEFANMDLLNGELTLTHPTGETAISLQSLSTIGNMRHAIIPNLNSQPGEWSLFGELSITQDELSLRRVIDDIVLILYYRIE